MAERKKNQLKNSIVEEEEIEVAEKPEKSKRKEKIVKPSLKERIENTFSFLKDERLHKITGLTCLLFAVYLLFAFASFLFTWQVDQDKVVGSFSELISSQIKVDNWLGKLGAIVSHKFIHEGFGIASFVFVLLLSISGLKLLLNISVLPILKTFKISFFALVYISIAAGFIFADSYFYLGGTWGYTMASTLNDLIGQIGTGALLIFSALVFMVVMFNTSFIFFKKDEIEIQEEALTTAEEPVLKNTLIEEDEDDEVVVPPSALELEIAPNKEEEKKTIEPEPSVELSTEIEEKEEIESDDDVQFTVEQTETDNTEIDETAETKIENEVFELGEYDPTLDLSSFQMPTLDLLENYPTKDGGVNAEELNANKDKIVKTLSDYNIAIEKIKATIGPTVTLYEIIPAAGVRISKIKNLEDDIALSLSALGIRIIAPIPGKGTIGIEVPNQNPEMVPMKTLLASDKFQNSTMDLPIALGKTISNETFIADLAKMPHLLMAGATGQGKSVGLNAILVSLLYKKHPSQIKFVLVDPKKVELTLFNKIEKHYLAKLPDTEEAIITDTKKVVNTLNSLCIEMDNRYELLKEAAVRNLKEYNAKFIARKLNPNKGHKYLPYIVLVIDEFADLIMTAGKEVETPIARLAQLARAIGIHLIVATQRPSVNIITGVIKANFPARIAFRVTSKIDSRTILDSGGADQLIGRGDMLLSTGNDLIRLQCAFVDTPEVDRITEFIGEQRGYPTPFILPEYVGEEEGGKGDFDMNERDSLFEEAAKVVVNHQQGSASLIQRKLKLGYNRAGRIIDQLEAAGVVGQFTGSKAREVLIKDALSLEQFLNSLDKENQKPIV